MSDIEHEVIVKRVPRHDDSRGWFISTWTEGLPIEDWVMQNVSKSSYGVVRGLHYQQPFAQSKLLTLIEGRVRDVIVCIDPSSDQFGQTYSYELSADDDASANQIFIPKGFAHGFSVLSEHALICYLTDELWKPEAEQTIDPFDQHLNIDWGVENPIVSEKDRMGRPWQSTIING